MATSNPRNTKVVVKFLGHTPHALNIASIQYFAPDAKSNTKEQHHMPAQSKVTCGDNVDTYKA